jgi:ribonuclease P protein subunit POP4
MIVVLQGKLRKSIPKAESTFRFRLLGGAVVEVEGRKIVGRPEDRVKRRIMRGW